MKTALSRIFEFFVAHNQREKDNPAQREYCICGALKPEVKRHERETPFKTESRTQGMNMAHKQPPRSL